MFCFVSCTFVYQIYQINHGNAETLNTGRMIASMLVINYEVVYNTFVLFLFPHHLVDDWLIAGFSTSSVIYFMHMNKFNNIIKLQKWRRKSKTRPTTFDCHWKSMKNWIGTKNLADENFVNWIYLSLKFTFPK